MAASYSNLGGTGNRAQYIATSQSAGFTGSAALLIDGSLTGVGFYFNGGAASGVYVRFEFLLGPVLITEAKFYQQNTTSHGTYKWQGSNDASSWTDIGSTFVLGGATTQTQTALSGNTTKYQYYQLIGVSGTNSNSPYLYEMEFNLDGVDTSAPSYYNPYGSGDRRLSGITYATPSTFLFGTSNLGDLLDGLLAIAGGHFYMTNGITLTSNHWLAFRFDAPRIITEVKWWQSATNSSGTWKWQGSNDGVTFVDIGSSFTLGGALIQVHTQLNGNSTAYEYYRLLGVSGTTSSAADLWELTFKISYDSTPIALPNWGSWTFPNGAVGIAYEYAWDMPLSMAPMAYSVLSGALPDGLSLDDMTGNLARVYGTPTVSGAFSFTLRAVNSSGTTDKAFSITITDAPAGGGAGNYGYVA